MVKVLLKQVHNFVTILRADSKFRDHGLNSLLKRVPPIDGPGANAVSGCIRAKMCKVLLIIREYNKRDNKNNKERDRGD